jgi:hypothetical protein
MNNFRSEFVSASFFKDIVCNYCNLMNMNMKMDIVHADIRRIWYCYYSADTNYPLFLWIIRPSQLE